MSDRIGGWGLVGASSANTPYALEKAGIGGAGTTRRQHVITGLSISFNGTPGTPVLCQLVDPDVSPNPVYWERYVAQSCDRQFLSGICIPPGAGVTLQVGAGGGSLIAALSLDGYTR